MFTKGKINTFIYGIGRTEIEKINVTEIDLFDIFYSIWSLLLLHQCHQQSNEGI